jgi:nicotinic acetylcholine receptor alpha-7
MFPRAQLDLQIPEADGDVSNYHTNGEFDLVSFRALKNVRVYSCCPEPYPDVTYTIVMKRRPIFYIFNLIIPCLLINGIGERKFLPI